MRIWDSTHIDYSLGVSMEPNYSCKSKAQDIYFMAKRRKFLPFPRLMQNLVVMYIIAGSLATIMI